MNTFPSHLGILCILLIDTQENHYGAGGRQQGWSPFIHCRRMTRIKYWGSKAGDFPPSPSHFFTSYSIIQLELGSLVLILDLLEMIRFLFDGGYGLFLRLFSVCSIAKV